LTPEALIDSCALSTASDRGRVETTVAGRLKMKSSTEVGRERQKNDEHKYTLVSLLLA